MSNSGQSYVFNSRLTISLLMGALYLYRLNSYAGHIVYRTAVHNINNLFDWHITVFAVITAVLVMYLIRG